LRPAATAQPTPDLLRGRVSRDRHGPGSGPGWVNVLLAEGAHDLVDGIYRLHSGEPFEPCNLCWVDARPVAQGRAAQIRARLTTYGALRHHTSRLAYAVRRSARGTASRAASETLASRLERRSDLSNKSTVGRSRRNDSGLSARAAAPDQVRGMSHSRRPNQ